MVRPNQETMPFLAIFTASERAAEWSKRQTTFGDGLSKDFAQVLQGMAADLGIVTNPGRPAGVDMQPPSWRGSRRRPGGGH